MSVRGLGRGARFEYPHGAVKPKRVNVLNSRPTQHRLWAWRVDAGTLEPPPAQTLAGNKGRVRLSDAGTHTVSHSHLRDP